MMIAMMRVRVSLVLFPPPPHIAAPHMTAMRNTRGTLGATSAADLVVEEADLQVRCRRGYTRVLLAQIMDRPTRQLEQLARRRCCRPRVCWASEASVELG